MSPQKKAEPKVQPTAEEAEPGFVIDVGPDIDRPDATPQPITEPVEDPNNVGPLIARRAGKGAEEGED